MKKYLFVAGSALPALVLFAASPVFADNDKLARFKDAIGVTLVSSGVGTDSTAEVWEPEYCAESIRRVNWVIDKTVIARHTYAPIA